MHAPPPRPTPHLDTGRSLRIETHVQRPGHACNPGHTQRLSRQVERNSAYMTNIAPRLLRVAPMWTAEQRWRTSGSGGGKGRGKGGAREDGCSVRRWMFLLTRNHFPSATLSTSISGVPERPIVTTCSTACDWQAPGLPPRRRVITSWRIMRVNNLNASSMRVLDR